MNRSIVSASTLQELISFIFLKFSSIVSLGRGSWKLQIRTRELPNENTIPRYNQRKDWKNCYENKDKGSRIQELLIRKAQDNVSIIRR